MKKFVSGIIVSKAEMEEFNFQNWYDANDGDYIVHALFDITHPKHPKTIMINDNTHTAIEDEIEAFIAGIDYADVTYSHKTRKLWVNENNCVSCYDANYFDLVEVVE